MLLPSGKILVTGYTSNGANGRDVFVLRYNIGGTPDSTFDGDGVRLDDVGSSDASAKGVVHMADGRIVVAGTDIDGQGHASFALVRFNAEGSPDTTFGDHGRAMAVPGAGFGFVSAMAVQPDGRILVAGAEYNGTNSDFVLMRFNLDGSVDSSLDLDGRVLTPVGTGDDYATGMLLQPDGRILVGGTAQTGGLAAFCVARYLPDGSLDAGFGSTGTVIIPVGSDDAGANALRFSPTARSCWRVTRRTIGTWTLRWYASPREVRSTPRSTSTESW